MSSPNTKIMRYLSVDPEDYVVPNRRRRSISPSLLATTTSDMRSSAPVPTLRVWSCNREISNLDEVLRTYNETRSESEQPEEILCYKRNKNKLNRHAKVHETFYRPRCNTDPGPKQEEAILLAKPAKATEVPVSLEPTPIARRRAGTGASALSSLIKQTLKVTTASMGLNAATPTDIVGDDGGDEKRLSECHSNLNNDDKGNKRKLSRSTNSVITLTNTTPNSSMAPLQSGHAETQSVTCLNSNDKNSSPQQQQQQHLRQHKRHLSQQYSVPGASKTAGSDFSSESYSNLAALGNNKSDTKSLKHSSTSLNPLITSASAASIRNISPSRKSVQSSSSGSGTTAKNEQSSSAAATAVAVMTTEKEKKRKEVSSSRVKKFHRHFTQLPKDEKLINYFSCALVSDILLQGHLYISDQHFAFYSNVFGYVTKVVIPTSSVTKISKEKTAKIIPNAVGVATADERHVFGSFISREAAFRLMCSVCPPLLPVEILPKIPADIEYSEEQSIEDDSSCSISGNESSPQVTEANAVILSNNSKQPLVRYTVAGSTFSIASGGEALTSNEKKLLRHASDIPNHTKSLHASLSPHHSVSQRTSAPPMSATQPFTCISSSLPTSFLTTPTTGAATTAATSLTMIIAGTVSSTSSSPSPSSGSSTTTSSPTTVMAPSHTAAQAAASNFKSLTKNALLRLKFPIEFHIVYLGVLLSIVLALFSGFLLYRILDIEAKTSLYRSSVVNWGSVNDDDIFAEALRWQKELQTKSTEEAQSILNTNLKQIAKVRRSLETLSMLIHDRSIAGSKSFVATTTSNAAESYNRDDSD